MPPDAQVKSNIFGTPPPLNRHPGDSLAAATDVAVEDSLEGPQIVEGSTSYQAVGGDADDTEVEETTAGFHTKVKLPKWGKIDDRWLEDAVEKVEQLAKTLPIQAHLEFSVETHLPFTLLIARATPSIAMRSMVSFVEYLAGIPTPPRARIEVTSNLDRSFHRNVEAALEPFFGEHFKVELEPGRVEIVFTEPDVSWQDYPVLPTE